MAMRGINTDNVIDSPRIRQPPQRLQITGSARSSKSTARTVARKPTRKRLLSNPKSNSKPKRTFLIWDVQEKKIGEKNWIDELSSSDESSSCESIYDKNFIRYDTSSDEDLSSDEGSDSGTKETPIKPKIVEMPKIVLEEDIEEDLHYEDIGKEQNLEAEDPRLRPTSPSDYGYYDPSAGKQVAPTLEDDDDDIMIDEEKSTAAAKTKYVPPPIPKIPAHLAVPFDHGHLKLFSAVEFNGSKLVACSEDLATLFPGRYLNDGMIDFAIQELAYRNLSKENFDSILLGDCQFSRMIMDGNKNALKITENVDIFKKNIAIMPVNIGFHWMLVVVLNLNKAINHESEEAFRILIFNSLVQSDDQRACQNYVFWRIRWWLNHVARQKGQLHQLNNERREVFVHNKFNLCLPTHNVYQDNNIDCGVYACFFAKTIFENFDKFREFTNAPNGRIHFNKLNPNLAKEMKIKPPADPVPPQDSEIKSKDSVAKVPENAQNQLKSPRERLLEIVLVSAQPAVRNYLELCHLKYFPTNQAPPKK